MVHIIHLMMEEKALYLWQKLMLLIAVFIECANESFNKTDKSKVIELAKKIDLD